MIRKKDNNQQNTFWITPDTLQVQPQIVFYNKLSQVLDDMEFGEKVRKMVAQFYSNKTNVRPPIDPEVYFKMLIVGFFENINSERGIAARCADSLSIRAFLKYEITQATPDHSTLSVTRKRLPQGIFSQMFSIVLEGLRRHGLVKGKNLSMDSSVIEANAALRSLKNRMTDESYAEYVSKLAAEQGIDPKDKSAVARFDRKRAGRKTSNKEWVNPHDPDAKIGKTKRGNTDMIYKVENIADLDSGAIIDADVLPGDSYDAHGESERIMNASIRLIDISENPLEAEMVESLASDKGYHEINELQALQEQGIETIIPDRQINRKIEGLTDEEQLALELASSASKSENGKQQQKKRGMYVERSFAHILDSGGFRRTHLRGIENNRKRYLIAVASYNLSLLMRKIFGIGTPKQCFALKYLLFFVQILRNIAKYLRLSLRYNENSLINSKNNIFFQSGMPIHQFSAKY